MDPLTKYIRTVALAAAQGLVVGLSVPGPDPKWIVALTPGSWQVVASQQIVDGDLDDAAELLMMRLALA